MELGKVVLLYFINRYYAWNNSKKDSKNDTSKMIYSATLTQKWGKMHL